MVDKLNKTEKYFAIVYWPKENKSKKGLELLDYFSTKEEADKEVERQKELDKHSDIKYSYDVLEKTGKQIKEMW